MLQAALLAALALLASCSTLPDCADLAPSAPATCAEYPELCRLPVRSTIHEPDLARAIDVVFVPEGYDDMVSFHDHVQGLIDDLAHDEQGIVAMDPTLFNYHWVPLDGQNIGGCWGDQTSLGPWLEADPTRAKLVAANAPDADVIVVILNTAAGRPNAVLRSEQAVTSPGYLVIGDSDDERTLTHELGHALFSLADEYVELDTCAPDYPLANATAVDDFPDIANESFDATGAKWAGLVDGARPGGRRYACGVYHPTDDCRMNSAYASEFCPVCEHAIRSELARRRAGANDGPPTCILGTNDTGVVAGKVFDRDAPLSYTLSVDGVPQWSSSVDYETTEIVTGALPGNHTFELQCTDAQGESTTVSYPKLSP